jgi:non-specific protein-tyrosine kinase
VSDAAAVAARADGVVLVVQHRQTSQEQVTAAAAALNAVSARLLGTVLTMTKGRLRRESRVPSYRTPAARVQGVGPVAPPAPVPAPNGHPGAPSEAAVPSNGAQPEGGTEPAPVPHPVDGSGWRPSPTPRS